MEFPTDRIEGVLVVIPGKLTIDDFYPFDTYEENLAHTINFEETSAVVMDIANIHFAATPLLAALVRLHLQARRRSKKFALCNPTAFVQEVLHKVRLDTLLRIFPSRQEAIDRMNAPEDFYAAP